MKKKILMIAMGALALVGCNQVQSSLEMADVESAGKATIRVYVTYDAGVQDVNGALVSQMENYNGAEVVAKVDYADYSAGAEGTKQFTAESKGNGVYEIVVNLGQKGLTGVEVEVHDFEADWAQTATQTVRALFEPTYVTPNTFNLSENDLKVVKVEMHATPVSTNTAITNVLKVKGKITAVTEALIYKDDEASDKDLESNISGIEQKAVAKQCQLKVILSHATAAETLEYTISTEEDGKYEFDANYFDTWDDITDVKVEIVPVPFVAEEGFTHRYLKYDSDEKKYKAATQKVSGYYDNAGSGALAATAGDLLLGKSIPEIRLDFTAEDPSNINGVTNAGKTIDGNPEYKALTGGIF